MITVAAALTGRCSKTARALGVAVLAVGGVYVALYYAGMSLYLLLPGLVPLAAGVGLALAWRLLGYQGRTFVAALTLLSVGAGIHQTAGLHDATSSAAHPVFDRDLQRRGAADLLASDTRAPWTFTYADAGVLELDTAAAIRPRHAFPLFWRSACGRGVAGYDEAWDRTFERLPDAELVLLVPLAPSEIAISPCRRGDLIHVRLAPAAVRHRRPLHPVRTYNGAAGQPVLRVYRLGGHSGVI